MTDSSLPLNLRAWYKGTILEFLNTPTEEVIGRLLANCDFPVLLPQRDAWVAEVEFLQGCLNGLSGSILLEFSIPRMGRRIDAVLLLHSVVIVIEFKVGEKTFDRTSFDQVWDYALDLKNFHEGSRTCPIVPILVATEAADIPTIFLAADSDDVYHPVGANFEGFREVVDLVVRSISGSIVDPQDWQLAPYHPTPTIIEAARSLYAQHSVEAIARFDAGAQNLHTTSQRIEDLVEKAREHGEKLICFVTGVPGAGKTLVGLNVATRRGERDRETSAVFLSGNGPLVAVLREALTRDDVARRRVQGEKVRKGKVGESVKAFIQNVHHFRDEALIEEIRPPFEHVVIFDEAQRAWNLRKTADFMQRRKKRPGFDKSEPEFLISYMDRHHDWAVVVCLVGGGQEINDGEAGIDAWLEAIRKAYPKWQMFISSRLSDSEYAAGKALELVRPFGNVQFDDCLHLAVSMRSFRAENVSSFVKALLDCEKNTAREEFAKTRGRYPVALTRDLLQAKKWIVNHARGTERFGLVASSKANRLKPHAIDIRVEVDPVHWFLSDREDTRSSYYLEDAATEFQVQGLELDWICVTWDADLRFSGSGWSYHEFRGDRWNFIRKEQNQIYLRNAYRVLLTRARQGMVIFVPHGESSDPTRKRSYYDATFEYLREIGIPVLE